MSKSVDATKSNKHPRTLRWFSAVATPCVIDIDLCFHERGDFAFIQAARAFGREIQADVSNYCAPKQESAAAATGSKKKGPKTSAVKSITLFEAEMELKYDKYLKEEIDDMVEKLCSPMKDAVGFLLTTSYCHSISILFVHVNKLLYIQYPLLTAKNKYRLIYSTNIPLIVACSALFSFIGLVRLIEIEISKLKRFPFPQSP